MPPRRVCGSGTAYDGRASDGNTYTFGSSGLLFRSNKLMYDRQTRTLWNHMTGEPVLGELAASEVKLSLLLVVLVTRRGSVIFEGRSLRGALASGDPDGGRVAYWFGWFTFFLKTLVYGFPN
jgi:hypothetical protein